MLSYKAAYKLTDGVFLGEVLDFPGTLSFGHTLEEARKNLASALFDMAEMNLLAGEPLPLREYGFRSGRGLGRTDILDDPNRPTFIGTIRGRLAMKRRDVIRHLLAQGCVLVREGGGHTISDK